MALIVAADTPARLRAVRDLFLAYAAEQDDDRCFQGFAQEVAGLPGVYAPPAGRLLLALAGDAPAGCVALRPLEVRVCEMKRLYVSPAFRAAGAGRELAAAVLAAAADIGYERMRLDTLPGMARAQELYRRLDFQPISPYLPNPTPGALCFERRLR